ncbi:MAG: HAMP domain-containing sensor histidine kinase [Euryarchaeota archaeon]|nr:HAMP domain-containing sensor histidine kinase [Euryarchaeota archaeon]
MVSLYMVENTEDKKKRKQYINKAVESIKRSKRLAKNIRMFKEINQRNATRINLNKSIRQSIERIKERFDRDIVVEYIEVKKHYIKANKFLEEVFISILENAVKYTQEEPVCIDIAVEEKEGRCNISIRDYGIGISKKKREDILESLETLSKRTGMGLYLVKKILQTFDGSFAIKEAPKGTEVVVRVPTIS